LLSHGNSKEELDLYTFCCWTRFINTKTFYEAMREFILLALKARTDDFALDKTEAGLVCRTVSNALWMSKGVRKDTIIHVVLNGPPSPPKTVSFYGKDMIGGGFDEQSIMGMLKISLEKGAKLTLHQQVESQPGIVVAKESFEALVQQKAATNQLIYLHPRGEDIRSFPKIRNIYLNVWVLCE